MRTVGLRVVCLSMVYVASGCGAPTGASPDVARTPDGDARADGGPGPDDVAAIDAPEAMDAGPGGDDVIVPDDLVGIDVSEGRDAAPDHQDASMRDVPDMHPTTAVSITIDTSRPGPTIPDDFVGLSFTRNNIAGNAPLRAIFSDPTIAPQLASVLQQIGVKHIRLLSDDAANPPPTPAQDAAFFAFARSAGLGDHSVIYSLNIHDSRRDPNASPPPFVSMTDTSNRASFLSLWNSPDRSMIEAFAFGNEPDWGIGTSAANYSAYQTRWSQLYDEIEQAARGTSDPMVPFTGPDTGNEYPARTHASADPVTRLVTNATVSGVPFTLQFARDEGARLSFAAQHYYGGANDRAPIWAAGAYYVGDRVEDPSDHFTYRCILDAPMSTQPPHTATMRWQPDPPIWSSSMAYASGDIVQDPADLSQDYQCVATSCPAGGRHPSVAAGADAAMPAWAGASPPVLSSVQMSTRMLDASQDANYATFLSGALTGATSPSWPAGLRFRMTESNAFSPGHDPANRIFALALWGLDYFHWWAAHGALGVDPFTLLSQYNAPVYEDHSGTADVVAVAPYGYGMLAFGQGSHGRAIMRSELTIMPAPRWLAAYPVLRTGHLYVTLINKSFDEVGSTDAVVTLRAMGFTAGHATYLALESAPGATGDATASTAVLGGARVVAGGHWAGTWVPARVAADGNVGPITVRATTAVVVDITP